VRRDTKRNRHAYIGQHSSLELLQSLRRPCEQVDRARDAKQSYSSRSN